MPKALKLATALAFGLSGLAHAEASPTPGVPAGATEAAKARGGGEKMQARKKPPKKKFKSQRTKRREKAALKAAPSATPLP